MKEFQEFSALYQKQKQYKVKVVGLTFFLLILVTVFVLINTRRINPFMLYVVAMGVVIFYAVKTRKVSSNYDLLLTFVKKNKPELLKEKELLFFIDYKLDKRYEKDPERLVRQLKSPKQKKYMLKKIKEQESKFKSLTDPKKHSKKKRRQTAKWN